MRPKGPSIIHNYAQNLYTLTQNNMRAAGFRGTAPKIRRSHVILCQALPRECPKSTEEAARSKRCL